MTIGAFTEMCRAALQIIYPAPEALTLSRHLIQERLGYSFSEMFLKKDEPLTEQQSDQLKSDLIRLEKGEPLQYVLGYAWFSELKIGVSKDVLIPRPETEELVQFIRDENFTPGGHMLDICTGSGCIALALKQSFPELDVSACDVSFEALIQAKKNAAELELNIDFQWADVLANNWGEMETHQYDLIVSNPPYIAEKEAESMHKNVLHFEPSLALFVPDNDPLIFYRHIAAFAHKKLKYSAQLWFEINEKYGEKVADILEENQFTDVRIYHDLSGKDRFVYGQMKTLLYQ